MPTVLCEGTGEFNRAVDAALGAGLPAERPRYDPVEAGEEAIGTGRGREDDVPFCGVDMVVSSLFTGCRWCNC